MLERLPCQFQDEALLRVDHLNLARAHLKEVAVEGLHVVQVAATSVAFGEDFAHAGIGLELKPTVVGQLGDPVAPGDQRLPRRLRGLAGLREAGGEANDRDVVVRVALALPERVELIAPLVGIALDDPLGQRGDRRVLVDDGGRQHDPGLVLDVAAEGDGIARGQPELLHRPVLGDLIGRHAGRLRDPFAEPIAQFGDGQVADRLSVGTRRLGDISLGGISGLGVVMKFRHRSPAYWSGASGNAVCW